MATLLSQVAKPTLQLHIWADAPRTAVNGQPEWLDGVVTLYGENQIQRRFTEAWQLHRPVFSTDVPSSSCSRHLPISHKQISRRCKHRESNSINNRRACFSRWSVRESSAPHIEPERTQLFFSAERRNLSVITGFEVGWKNLAHANYL